MAFWRSAQRNSLGLEWCWIDNRRRSRHAPASSRRTRAHPNDDVHSSVSNTRRQFGNPLIRTSLASTSVS
jgi:hypothetical protein